MNPTVPQAPAHVLVVGSGRDLPARLRRLGARTSVMCRSGFLPKLQAAGEHARVLALSADSPDAEWVALAAAVHAADPFTAVAAYGERDQDRCAAIGAALGLPTHSPRTVALVHHKESMRLRLREAGVDPTASARVAGLDALRAFAGEYGLPLIVKPVTGAGSSGVSLVSGEDGLADAFARASGGFEGLPDAGVLVEQYHRGPEFSVEAFSEDGDHQVVAVTEKHTDPVTFVELGHAVPAPLSGPRLKDVEVFVYAVLDALGVTHGPTHTEVVLTAAGPRIVETHIRLGGDDIPLLVAAATGVDLVDHTVRQTLGERVLPGLRERLDGGPARGAAAIWFASAERRGVLEAVTGVAEAEAEPGVTAVRMLVGPGAECGGLDSSYTRIAAVRTVGPDPAEAVRRARRAAARLGFRMRPAR